jgi:hypothetical protein
MENIPGIIRNKIIMISLFLGFISCGEGSLSSNNITRYECPCGGYGKVAQGTIITIEEKNAGDEKAILDAVEKKLGGKCCELEEDYSVGARNP